MDSKMTFMQKFKRIVRIRNLIVFCLILLLIWWGGSAILKYWNQPLTTDTRYVFGDNESGIQFPVITICDYDLYIKNPLLKDCKIGPRDLIGSFLSCMKKDKNFTMESFTNSLQLDVRKIVSVVRVWTGSEMIILQDLDSQAWSKIFNYFWGFCHTFDLSKIEKFEYVSYKEIGRPILQFVMAENSPWKKQILMLHTKNDLPDAWLLNGYSTVEFSNTTKQYHRIDLKKQINKRESTRKVPCEKYEYRTCQSIEDNQLIFDKFHCRIPILYSGQHLDGFIPKDLMNCSHDATEKGLDFILKKKTKCKQTQTCEMTRFTSTNKVIKDSKKEVAIWVAFANPEVQYQHTFISYDLISLIGEIGGIIGITLGASTLTFFDSLFQPLRYY